MQHTGTFLHDVGDREGHKPFGPSNPICTRLHCNLTGSERINHSSSSTKSPLTPAPPSFPRKCGAAATLHPRAGCILGEPGSGGSTKTRCLSDLHAVHIDAEVDLELSAHLDDLGHAVQQHVVELGRGKEEEERIGWSPAPACSELGASPRSRVLHSPGAELVLGKNPA